MNGENIQLLVHRISLGHLYFKYNNVDYIYVSPTTDIKYEAELFYEQIINDNKFESWITQDALKKFLEKIECWTKEDEELLKSTEKNLEKLKLNLYYSRLQKEKVNKIKKDIEWSKDSINKLLKRKHSFDYLTLEDYAAFQKNEYLFIQSIFYRKNKERVFDSNPDYNNFINITSHIAENFINIETYKKIARNEYWKTLWNSNKNNVFNKAAYQLTDEQKTLINISIMYDRIYENPECPQDFVIEDDDMLDGWMLDQKQKNDNLKKEKTAEDLLNKHKNAKEVFVVSSREDAGNIFDLNSPDSNRIIKQRSRVISKAQDDGIDEFNLPDVKQDIFMKTNTARTG
jgi:hypothetical protein